MRRHHRSLRLGALLAGALLAIVLLLPASGGAHPERITKFPYPQAGSVPVARSTGPAIVVCQRDSLSRLKRIYGRNRRALRPRLQALRRCHFRSIQSAVNAAKSGDRILLLPGVYTEPASRRVPVGSYGQPPCANDYVETEGFTNNAPPPAGPASDDPPVRANRNYHLKCPNSKNLIAIAGDPRTEDNPLNPGLPICMQKCNLQISGYGRGPGDVVIQGDRHKTDVLRVDRANGIYLSNFTIEQGAFNDIDLVEVDGFHVHNVVARYAQNYGVLSFTAVHGLFENIEAYNNGDSGVYPGSNAKGCNVDPNAYGNCDAGASAADPRAGCGQPTTELRNINSHDNVLGYSGTAGNSTYVHDSDFHDNNTGLATDSFASGHPGMPQECFRWEHNRIHSNNVNYFTAERQNYCNSHPFASRPKELVCPQFQTAVGTGIIIGGGNRDLVQHNEIYDNWRWGVALISVPASVRGDNDPGHQTDTSNGSQFMNNRMGIAGTSRAPNGTDFFWDEEGVRNCWAGNSSLSGPAHQSTPASLPGCPGSDIYHPANPATYSMLVPCTAWDPERNPRPVGCDWFDLPAKPS